MFYKFSYHIYQPVSRSVNSKNEAPPDKNLVMSTIEHERLSITPSVDGSVFKAVFSQYSGF